MTDSNVNYNYQTVIQSWDIPVFNSLPEIVPQKEDNLNYKNFNKISPEFIRNMSMYDVFNDVFVDTLNNKSNKSKKNNNMYEYFVINNEKNNKKLLIILIIITILILLYLLYA